MFVFLGVPFLTWSGVASLSSIFSLSAQQWGTELNGPQHPEDTFATLDLDPEVFEQGLCCVYP